MTKTQNEDKIEKFLTLAVECFEDNPFVKSYFAGYGYNMVATIIGGTLYLYSSTDSELIATFFLNKNQLKTTKK